MQYTVRLIDGVNYKLYYNEKVYSPKYSSIDTILVVDKLLKDGGKLQPSVLDVGCGTGVIGLGVKLLNPNTTTTMCDFDSEAVRVSKLNAKRLGVSVTVHECDLLPKLGNWDIICANLPTYSKEDMEQELHGPKTAYYSGGEPLAMYARLFDQAKDRCHALVVECQAKYQKPLLLLAGGEGWTLILNTEFAFAFLPPKSQ